jgi:hypothetical protein
MAISPCGLTLLQPPAPPLRFPSPWPTPIKPFGSFPYSLIGESRRLNMLNHTLFENPAPTRFPNSCDFDFPSGKFPLVILVTWGPMAEPQGWWPAPGGLQLGGGLEVRQVQETEDLPSSHKTNHTACLTRLQRAPHTSIGARRRGEREEDMQENKTKRVRNAQVRAKGQARTNWGGAAQFVVML